MPKRPARVLRAFLLGAGLVLLGCACQGPAGSWVGDTDFSDPRRPATEQPPPWRREGPRLPAFSGGDPTARGWVKVDDLLWIHGRDADAYTRGLVSDGKGYVPRRETPPPNVSAKSGFRLRTDHVSLQTNVAWDEAVTIAREAEAHVHGLLEGYGDLLGLRLPAGPLRIVVTASRAEFRSALQGIVHDEVTWGAFYDARSGIVYTSLEAAPAGALPWQADLRHEMTHQILDLSRSPSSRAQPFRAPWFWLWEGIAIWTETLGDAPGTDSGAERLTRFRKRFAWKEWTPLDQLFPLTQRRFKGRHYDQTASLMRYLLDPAAPARRRATLDVVARLMKGRLADTALLRALGTDMAGLQAAWLETVDR